MKTRVTLILLLAVALAGCGYTYDEHLVGPYDLIAIDVPQQMSVYYNLGNGDGIGRINQTVFSVGWNNRYIVAKQHPDNDRKVTNFFYLDMTKDYPDADPSVSVTGSLTEAQFERKRAELALPGFQLTIQSLQ